MPERSNGSVLKTEGGRKVARGFESHPRRSSPRAFRGLALVFVLAFANLLGVALTAAALGGVVPWTRWQFVGLFGAIETASGLANVVTPNIWRLPVAELQTSERTDVKLAGSALVLPHWGGLARSAAGLVCLGLAAWQVGLSAASLALVPFLFGIAWVIVALSAALARAGVTRPDLDVIQFAVRWRRGERKTPPISIGASCLQFFLSIATIPAVKLLPPSVLYQPELAPSGSALLATAVAALAGLVLVYSLWSGRIDWRAPAEQQREAEEHA